MKKIIPILLIIGLALWACNTPGDGTPSGSGPGEGVTGEGSDHIYEFANAEDYPGIEIKLSDLKIEALSDISGYARVTVDATLYTDTAGETKATAPTGDKKNLAQFKLLKATGQWDENSNTFGTSYSEHTKDGMSVDGPTSWIVPNTASGIPTILLVQANWVDFTEDGVKVKSMKINSVTFSPKTDAPLLDVVYGESFLTAEGNKITFNNAMYSDAAAIFKFQPTIPATTTLAGKQLVIKFSIPEHTCVPSQSGGSSTEHQINFQAANSDKVKFNGHNPPDHGGVGQKYITLDSTNETGWAENSGTIRVPLNDLLAAADVSADANDCKGPFTLDAVRICNNGTTWNDGGTAHIRCKSYPLVIDSVTVE
ncbi:MAG: hypothetical protein LBB72_03555 [Spirochaetaceae bacterium]|nr:hypothetical protein [Spirochaetaceae bacterium]